MERALASTVVAFRHQRPSAADDNLCVNKPASEGRGTAWDAMMAAAQNGNSLAYHRLLSQVAVRLRAYYARRLPPTMIDDTIQEVLVAIHVKRGTYDPSRSFEVWLMAIARYKWIDALRSLKTKATEALDDDIPIADHGEAVVNAQALDQLLATLSPAQSDVIRLVKLEGLSIEEASAITGQSAALVKVNVHRGIKKLTSFLRIGRNAD
jgi:RNA polymerase sigma-70 factor (ECF subfamily)